MRAIRKFVQVRDGAAAVEFAVIAPMMVLSVVFIMIIALILYMNQVLDYATSQAARQIITGAAQTAGTDQATFKANLCKKLPILMSCSNVVVNLYIVPPTSGTQSGYYAFVKPDLSGLLIPPLTSGAGQYNLGSRGTYQYLQVIYPITFLPSALASVLGAGATYNGSPAYLTIATAAFRNENF